MRETTPSTAKERTMLLSHRKTFESNKAIHRTIAVRPQLLILEDRVVPAQVFFKVANDWGSGFQGEIRIVNDGPTAINGWKLEFDASYSIQQIWNGKLDTTLNHNVVKDVGWNATIAPSKEVSFGFLAYPGNPAAPTNYLLNGQPLGGPPAALPSLSVTGGSVAEGNPSTAAVSAGYLATSGNQIVDANGNNVRVSGVNWFGFETSNFAPHGLWTRGYKSMMDQMKQQGFNTIRLPFSNQLFDAGSVPNGIDFSKNPDLQGLNGLGIMDKIVTYAGQIGLRIMLDNHRSAAGNGPNENGLWYMGNYSETRWINDWTMLAQRYANNPTVIAADLLNEPHGQATWGDGNLATDWRLAAQRAGNAILAVNPNLLVVVEGIESGTNGSYWWGGNLSKAGAFPVQLNVANRLVYSPHDYPSTVYNQPWFGASNYPNNLPAVWDAAWGYLYRQNIAPVLIGEFGTKLQTSSDAAWLAKLVDYMKGDLDGNGSIDIPAGKLGVSWTYWSWNPNSSDTGGILADDWQTVNTNKVVAVAPVQFGPLGTGGSTSGNTNYIDFTVKLSAASTTPVTVQYTTVDGTATAGSDYQSATGTLTFAPGETVKTVRVSLSPDITPELDETLQLRLSAPVNATLGTAAATGTILNDDGPIAPPPPPPPPSMTIDNAQILEGNTGSVYLNFNVRLSAASTTPVTVNYGTQDGTAAAGSDYAAAAGTVTFNPGEVVKTIAVQIFGDTLVEPDETFRVVLNGVSGATLSNGTATGTIKNDDQPPPPPTTGAVSFTPASQWNTGFTANVNVTNTTGNAITGWEIEFDAAFNITNIWNAQIVSHVGTHYKIRAMAYNGALGVGASTSWGFQADGTFGQPANVVFRPV